MMNLPTPVPDWTMPEYVSKFMLRSCMSMNLRLIAL